jgi:dienelactone hydrolase
LAIMPLRSLAHGARRVLLGAALAALLAHLTAAPGASGLQHEVVFADYTPLSTSLEMARRLLSPLTAAEVREKLARSGTHLIEQPINLAEERFALYVPATVPPQGYGLLVFVPPWQDARLPAGWEAVLDRYGMIYASAARSGNAENPIGRRQPLALLAAYNIMQRFPVDAAHVYVGGFSGGSRIALRLALGYPDVFHGALLNAGSDPLGGGIPPLPPAELFRQFQESMRLVLVTGDQDHANLAIDAETVASLRRWCVFGVDTQVNRGAAHQVAGPRALAAALQQLATPASADAAKLAGCRADIERDLAMQLEKVQVLINSGQLTQAQTLLTGIDHRFGGLAGPRSVELQKSFNCNPAQPDEQKRAQCERAGGPDTSRADLIGGSVSRARR